MICFIKGFLVHHYFATRLLEDELEHPKHAFADPDTGKLRMDPEQLRDSCSAFSIEYATKAPSVGRRNVPQVSAAPKPCGYAMQSYSLR